MTRCKKCGGKKLFPYDILDTCEKCTPIPLRGWHKTKDGKSVDKAYEGCIHYYRRGEVTGNDTCHCFCQDSPCCEESKGTVCQMIQYAPGKKSDKIRYIYFKIADEEKDEIEKNLGCNRRYAEKVV